MTPAPLHFRGERLMLDPAGVLCWPARRTLVVSDLHLEKGSHQALRGHFVPPYDTRETLARLVSAVRRYSPARLVLLGDSFHDADGSARMLPGDRDALAHLLRGLEVVWILGNHDPSPPQGLPGEAGDALRDGPLLFRHAAETGAEAGEISGHFHPKATLATRVGGISRPCFLADPRRLILPAFGAYTGGLDVRAPALRELFPRGGQVWLLGRDRLHAAPLPVAGRRA